ncbi:TPA: hypothetical protein N0F65_003271 [Lagenidium giganteum]|uniref:Uncharacterized protein n=1 Tax=Lagenidium giganteum TaxID=4803 RepID=A0AAV2YD84_9STRA|nr:TPA: hypothetical protein N0F65_003271 [Lagenidium giganteum]
MFTSLQPAHYLRAFPASQFVDDRCCQYPSKHCKKPRAVKRNGELHRFCELHREIANRNQRKLDRKRRMRKKQLLLSLKYITSLCGPNT